jgi:hypothetical protein
MAPPLSKAQLYSRDKFYNLLKNKYENKTPSRRQVADFLSVQEVNQLCHPSKGKPKDIKSSMTSSNTIIAIDLVDLKNK